MMIEDRLIWAKGYDVSNNLKEEGNIHYPATFDQIAKAVARMADLAYEEEASCKPE